MSESTKAKLAAARRLLKEHQKKKESSIQPHAVEDQARPASFTVSTAVDSGSGNGYQQITDSTRTPPPSNISLDLPIQPINGNHSHTPQSFSFSQDYSQNPTSSFFDNLPPSSQVQPDENTYKLSSITPPLFNSIAMTDRTDSSSSTSTKSDESSSARRLIGLESQLAMEVGRKEELEFRLSETKENVKFLEKEVSRLQHTVDQMSKDRTPHEEKLNMQLRTIEILVSEKSELQQELALITEESKRNAEKCVEFSVKMKALKSEVARLQSEARDNNEARQQHNSILKKLEHSLNEANSMIEQYNKEIELNHEEIQELKRIIHENDQKHEYLKKELEEAKRKLSLAEMKIAQYGGNFDESLQSSANNFEGECEKLREEVSRMRKEVAENTSQYKDYIETLSAQLQQVNNQYQTCVMEKNELLGHKEGLLKQLQDLEKQISKERQTGPSLSQSNVQLNEQLAAAHQTVEDTKILLDEKTKHCNNLAEQLAAAVTKLQETELALEQLEVPDAKLLQAAMESDRIAASRAIEQNTSLKSQLTELNTEMNHSIVKLNNEKLDLTEKLQHAEYLIKELNGKLGRYKHKENLVYTDSVAQCPMIFQKDYSVQTDVDDLEIVVDPEHVTPEAMKLLEEKLKKTMEQVANLSDEKQRLEHLVLQLQGETETICEYVTLYQNQRGLLREKVLEREKQLALLSKERKELKEKLSQISHLLPELPLVGPNQPGAGNLPIIDDATSRIKTLLTEIESSNLVQDKLDGTPNTFHPCLLCSGKLITV
uniref:Golgin subfamily A member 2 n=2 Tax=Lygus hesperus TaxID=30085 RepID=A0A0A9Z4M1_LYGHE